MSWKEEYLASIEEAESLNPVNAELVDICTRLADKIMVLEAEKECLASPTPVSPIPPKPKAGYFSSASPAPETPPPKTDPQLRQDLAEALRSNTQMEHRLRQAEKEVVRSRHQIARDAKAITTLTSERNLLMRKAKDRDEELKGKDKLLEEVQDELLTINMELNIVRDKEKQTIAENKELIDRWMKLKGNEVDVMNERNEPRLSRQR